MKAQLTLMREDGTVILTIEFSPLAPLDWRAPTPLDQIINETAIDRGEDVEALAAFQYRPIVNKYDADGHHVATNGVPVFLPDPE